MIRASMCLAIILVSMLVGLPSSQIGHASSLSSNGANSILPYHLDPNGTLAAFNTTLAQFDLYTNASATVSSSSNGTLTWISTMTNTAKGGAIPNTGFTYSVLVNKTVTPPQRVNWNLTIPKGVGSTTYVRFDWNGTVQARTSARYLLFNGTGSGISPIPFVKVVKNQTFTVGTALNSTGGTPLSCGAGHECIDVSKFIGRNMTLTFIFNSTSTGGGLVVRVANVEVASTGTIVNNAVSHSMQLNPSNSTEVLHNARLSLTYNANFTFTYDTNKNSTHIWRQMLTSFFEPATYLLDSITVNGTSLIPAAYPFSQGACSASPCSNGKFISLNMTVRKTTNAVVLVKARSINAITGLTPTVLGVPTSYFVPGDTMAVRMKSSPGVNVSASQQILIVDSNGLVFPGPAAASNKGGTYLYNITVPLFAKPGSWLVNGTFTSSYDLGFSSQPFSVEMIQPAPNSLGASGGAGSNTPLTVHGSLNLISNSNTPAQNVNVTVFALDNGASPGPLTSQGATSTSTLYVKNITLVNGVFTASQQLTMLFAVVNPTTQPVEPFNATVTIEHEWYTSQTHGVRTTFNLTLGDQPFTTLPQSTAVYRADISLNQQGIQLQVRSVTSPASPPISLTMSIGSPPVTNARQHFGKFRITITSTNKATGSTNISPPVESPTYAFTLDNDLIPSRYLASSTTVFTASDGSFSTSIVSDRLLGARNLVLFALARDVNGITLFGTNTQKIQKTTFFSDSTLLIPSADIPSDVATKQTITVTLNLKSNSSTIPQSLTVNLDLSGTGIVSSHTFKVPPGTTLPVSFTFQAPSAAGSYLLTFSSPNYLSGVPLLTKTLQVSILPGNLQILIPALIGLVVALVILGYYALKRNSRVSEEEEEEKPKTPSKPQKPQSGPQTTKSLTRSWEIAAPSG